MVPAKCTAPMAACASVTRRELTCPGCCMNKSNVIFDIFLAPRDFAAEVRTGMEMCWRALKLALNEAAPSVSTPTTATKSKFPFNV